MEEPQPPDPQEPGEGNGRSKKGARGIGTIAAAAALAATKFAAFAKILAGSWTFVLSLVLYAAFFGWRLGIVIVLALAAHEMGHYVAYRAYGLTARLPVFVPFLGAYTAGAIAPDLEQDAYIALAGPLTGLVLAGACYAVGAATADRFWLACADLSAFLNLFNMLPMLPFDGGRAIGAVWPPLWIAGGILFIVMAAFLHVPIVLVALIVLIGLPSMLAAMRGGGDPRAAAMTNGARARVSVWYLIIALGLILVLGQAHGALPSNNAL